MTVSTTESRISHDGNGSTTAFSYPYLFLSEAHLVVILVVDATGVETTQVLTTNYTTTGEGDAGGGTVTMLVAPATGETLVISRATTLDQAVDYQSNDTFPAETHEGALDKLTLIAQDNASNNERALTLSAGDTTTSNSLPTTVADQLLGWNSAGTALQNYSQTALDTTLLPTLVANQVLGVNAAATAIEFKFTMPAASANKGLAWNALGTDIENVTVLKPAVTDNLTVGFTTDVEVLASDTIAPDMALEAIKTRAVVGTVQINLPTNGQGVCYIVLTVDATGGYAVNLGTGVKAIGTLPTLAASTTYMAVVVRHTAALATVQIEAVAA
jgi:hypothetical protein